MNQEELRDDNHDNVVNDVNLRFMYMFMFIMRITTQNRGRRMLRRHGLAVERRIRYRQHQERQHMAMLINTFSPQNKTEGSRCNATAHGHQGNHAKPTSLNRINCSYYTSVRNELMRTS
jgi:hypothetical protein